MAHVAPDDYVIQRQFWVQWPKMINILVQIWGFFYKKMKIIFSWRKKVHIIQEVL